MFSDIKAQNLLFNAQKYTVGALDFAALFEFWLCG